MTTPIRFKRAWSHPTDYYAVGVDELNGTQVLEVVITAAGWYSRFFGLTREELEAWERDPEALGELARGCAGRDGIRDNVQRFLYSQLLQENP